ncbi:MAG: lamin tail domain-containing protein [Candidatus Woesearchaeota archaeon]
MKNNIYLIIIGITLILATTNVIASPTANHVVISQVMFYPMGTDAHTQWIELYNPTSEIINISSWSITKNSGAAPFPHFIPQNTYIEPYSYFLIGGSAVTDNTPDLIQTNLLGATNKLGHNDGIILMDSEFNVIDRVGWGFINNPDFYEENTIIGVQQGQSIERKEGEECGNGIDTNNNSFDFFIQSNPYPRNSLSPQIIPCNTALEELPPEISNVQIIDITNKTAIIEWNTNFQTTAKIDYGIIGNESSVERLDPTYNLSHSILLEGLNNNTLYTFTLESCNEVNTCSNYSGSFTTEQTIIDDNGDDNNIIIECHTDLDCGSTAIDKFCDDLTHNINTTIPYCENPGTEESFCNYEINLEKNQCENTCDPEYGCDYEEPIIECYTDLDCGIFSSNPWCDEIIHTINETTPVCENPGTIQSFCHNITEYKTNFCSNSCDPIEGCINEDNGNDDDNNGDNNNDIITCENNADCGEEYITSECVFGNHVISIITPTCFENNTINSYCEDIIISSTNECNYMCHNELGCDYADWNEPEVIDDLMVNYIRGKIIIDEIHAPSGASYTVTITSGINQGYEFIGYIDYNIPEELQNQGYFDTLDNIYFNTGDNFKVTVNECKGELIGTFENGGNIDFEDNILECIKYECVVDNDCVNYNQRRCDGKTIVEDIAFCNAEFECEIETEEINNCSNENPLINECGNAIWTCVEIDEGAECKPNITPTNVLCQNYCNETSIYESTCNPDTFMCDINLIENCSDLNELYCDGTVSINKTYICENAECVIDVDTTINCDDGIFCNGQETCEAGICIPGTPIECSIYNINEITECGYDDGNENKFYSREEFISVCDENLQGCPIGDETITQTCDIEICGAECETDEQCQDTTCQSGCIGNDWYEYENEIILNQCFECGCEQNECTPTISFNDYRCIQEPSDNDCNFINDAWEIFYGFPTDDPDLPSKEIDSDNDGRSDYIEGIQGTNPFVPDEFEIIDMIVSSEDVKLIIPTFPGNKYAIEGTNDFSTWNEIITFDGQPLQNYTEVSIPIEESYMIFRAKGLPFLTDECISCRTNVDCEQENKMYCNGTSIVHEIWVCNNNYECEKTTEIINCSNNDGPYNECGEATWTCREENDIAECVTETITPNQETCNNFCDDTSLYQSICNDETFECEASLLENCSDRNELYCDGTTSINDTYTCENAECVLENRDTEECDDGLFCTGQNTCEAGICIPGTPIDCSAYNIDGISECGYNDGNENKFYSREEFISQCNEYLQGCTTTNISQLVSTIGNAKAIIQPEIQEGMEIIIERQILIVNNNNINVKIQLLPNERLSAMITEINDYEFILVPGESINKYYSIIIKSGGDYDELFIDVIFTPENDNDIAIPAKTKASLRIKATGPINNWYYEIMNITSNSNYNPNYPISNPDETITQTCDIEQCSAICETDNDCPDTPCESGCGTGDNANNWYEFEDVANECTDECGCTNYECGEPINIIYNDYRCRECQDDSDCSSRNNLSCDGTAIIENVWFCNENYECQLESTRNECEQNDIIVSECGTQKIGCFEDDEIEPFCTIIGIEQNDELCNNSCISTQIYTGMCDENFECQMVFNTECSDLNSLYCDGTISVTDTYTCENAECVLENRDTEECDDGFFCTGQNTCEAGICIPGTPIDCSAYNIDGIASCDNNPDGNPYTWDYRESFTSICDEELQACTTGDETITHTCDMLQCDAQCENDNQCPDTICNSGCGIGENKNHWFEYSNVNNICTDECGCTSYECGAPDISYNDYRCTECQTNEDCNEHNELYCSGSTVIRKIGICNENYECETIQETENCGEKGGFENECGALQWGCTETLNSAECTIVYAVADNNACDGVCDGNLVYDGICNPNNFECELEYRENCSDNDGSYCDGTLSLTDIYSCENAECVVVSRTTIECDDGIFCNGQETCEAGICIPGIQVDCSIYNIDGIASCDNNPDGNPYTWDYRESFTSVCDETLQACTIGDETITHTCDIDQCGAICETNNDCPDTICESGCVGKHWVEYNNVTNACTSECGCEQNTCGSPSNIIYNDQRCEEHACTTDADCEIYNNIYCNESAILNDTGFCNENFECQITTTEILDCNQYSELNNECGVQQWTCIEQSELPECMLQEVIPSNELCPDSCENNVGFIGLCNPETYYCEYTPIEECDINETIIIPETEELFIKQTLSLQRIAIDNDGFTNAGNEIMMYVTLRNSDNGEMNFVRMQIGIPELGVVRRIGPMNLASGQTVTRSVPMFIPYGTLPGEYDVRIRAYSPEHSTTQHRHLTIVR